MIELAGTSVRTRSMLQAARPMKWNDDTLRVEVAGPMRSVLDHRREEVEQLLRKAVGRKVLLHVESAEPQDEEAGEAAPDALEVAREHPLVRQAMELFDGKVETAFFKRKT